MMVTDKTDIVALAAEALKLRREGRVWRGMCPFHASKARDLHVYRETQHFRCYGCGETGDRKRLAKLLAGRLAPKKRAPVSREASREWSFLAQSAIDGQILGERGEAFARTSLRLLMRRFPDLVVAEAARLRKASP